MSEQELEDKLGLVVSMAHAAVLQVITERNKSVRGRYTDKEMKRVSTVFVNAARDILKAVKEAGYSLPSKGDLRGQLLSVGRALKAQSFHRGYSGDGTVETQIADAVREIRAETMADIGEIILRELES